MPISLLQAYKDQDSCMEAKWLFEAVEQIEVTTIGLNVSGDNIMYCHTGGHSVYAL